MAELKVLTLDNLDVIKNYIDVNDAKAIKALTIDGNTIKVYDVPRPVGDTEPMYEIELPEADLSGVLAKLTGAVENNVVTVGADGTVKDSGIKSADLALKSEVTAVSDIANANKTAIEAINNADTGIVKTAKDYADEKIQELVDGQIKTNTEAIAAINNADTGILKTAKDYADEKVKALSDGQVATNKTDIATMKGQIEALEAGTYDDSELRDLIDEKADKATTIAGYGITDAYTKTEVDSAITTAVGNAEHLKRSIVTTLPEVASADVHTIYMVEITGGDGNQKYEEFMLINGAFEKIGDSAVDLTDYATKAYADQAEADALSAAKTYADGLDTAMDARVDALETKVGEGVVAISEDEINALFTV